MKHARKGAWLTLVEVGDFEPLGELQNDTRWWFSASNHLVKTVLFANFERTRRTITLEKWEKESQVRLGATTARQATLLKPVLRQSNTMVHWFFSSSEIQ
ncbi:hypothetical protein F4819DRAFT_479227 [Hypoxylon fuscum]|nr:hypothetical protein F4819DRAFT_479227 [Hypoxylon fuscum]